MKLSVTQILLLRHHLDVLEMQSNGTTEKAVDELTVELVVVQVIIVVFAALCQHCGAHTLHSSPRKPIFPFHGCRMVEENTQYGHRSR